MCACLTRYYFRIIPIHKYHVLTHNSHRGHDVSSCSSQKTNFCITRKRRRCFERTSQLLESCREIKCTRSLDVIIIINVDPRFLKLGETLPGPANKTRPVRARELDAGAELRPPVESGAWTDPGHQSSETDLDELARSKSGRVGYGFVT